MGMPLDFFKTNDNGQNINPSNNDDSSTAVKENNE